MNHKKLVFCGMGPHNTSDSALETLSRAESLFFLKPILKKTHVPPKKE
jgi:hypothetical protein